MILTSRWSYIQGFLRSRDLTSRASEVQGFLRPGEFTSIGADVHGFLRSEIVVLVSGVILCRGSYVRGFYVRGYSRPWVLLSRSSYVFFILHFFRKEAFFITDL